MRFLEFFLVHQAAPPGPIIGSLEPFLILAIFHAVYQVLKGLPGIADCRCPRHGKLQIADVLDTSFLNFKPTCPQLGPRVVAGCRCPGTPESRRLPVSWTPESRILPVSRTPGSIFLTAHCFFSFKLQAIATAFKAIIYQKSL